MLIRDMYKVVRAAGKFTNQSTCRAVSVRKCTTTGSSGTVARDVPGLSKNIVDVPSSEVGFPSASKKGTYKNPEYFCYHNVSYFEAEVEMLKYRLPQPSSKTKLK